MAIFGSDDELIKVIAVAIGSRIVPLTPVPNKQLIIDIT